MDIMTTSEVILQVITTRFNCQLVVLHVGNWYAWFQKPHANILIDMVTLLVSIYYCDQEPITCRDYNLNIAQYYVCVVCVCMCMRVCIHISTAKVIHNVLDTSVHQWKYCLQIPAQKTENVVYLTKHANYNATGIEESTLESSTSSVDNDCSYLSNEMAHTTNWSAPFPCLLLNVVQASG